MSFRGKMTIPFDLDAIFTMNYDVTGLKKVLEFIFSNLGEMNETLKTCSASSAEALEKATSHDDLLKHL